MSGSGHRIVLRPGLSCSRFVKQGKHIGDDRWLGRSSYPDKAKSQNDEFCLKI